jgi:N-acetylneuraminic acid mutarotase
MVGRGFLFLDKNILEILELYVALIKENVMKSTRKMTDAIFAMFLSLLIITFSNQAFAQSGAWETKAPMPTARWQAASGVINGKLYVAGGWSGVSLNTLEVYDPATNTWAAKASMPTARYGASGGVINGKLYVVGGDIAQNQKLATLEIYDPATDTWATKASMSTPRSGPGAVAIDGKLYVAGGCQGWCAPVTNVLEAYDPATDTWTTRSSLPTARGGTDVDVVNGLFYVMGGCCGAVSSESDLMAKTIETYNPMTNTWTTKTQHLVGMNDTAGSINGKIYVAKSAETEVYDPATDTWAFLPPMATARQYAAGGVINGKLYVAGGYDGAAGSATLEVFTPFTGMPCICDVSGDGKIGFAEAICALQVLSGLRTAGCNQPTLTLIDGVCGSANGGIFTTAPSAGLCGAGSATSVTGTGPWSWSCTGANGGATAACAATLTVPSATLVSIAVTPTMASIPMGLTQSFVATGAYSDGATRDISNTVTWTSGANGVATVVSPGIANGLLVGTTMITATSGNASASATLNISAATLVSIAVTPLNASIPMGLTQRFVATGSYSDGASFDIGNTVTWTSGAIAVATVVSPGIASGLSVGTAMITATSGYGSGSATLTVTPATEVWVGSNGQGTTNTTYTKDAGGTITTTGQWTYNYQGGTVTCLISAGTMTVTGTNITSTSTGTATNLAAPPGYQTSSFTLSLTGTMSGGQGSGASTISFQTAGWPAPISGSWTAQRQSGSGVTN